MFDKERIINQLRTEYARLSQAISVLEGLEEQTRAVQLVKGWRARLAKKPAVVRIPALDGIRLIEKRPFTATHRRNISLARKRYLAERRKAS